MKKLLILLIVAATTLLYNTGLAQTPFARTRTATATAAGTTVDTLTSSSSSDTIYHTLQIPGTNYLTIQLDVVKVSGTFASKAFIYGSTTGNNYVLIDSSAVYNANSLNANTYTKAWSYSPGLYLWYKVVTYSSGTETLLPKVTAVIKPYYQRNL